MFLMHRDQWEKVRTRPDEPVPIDVSQTPLARLQTEVDLAAAVAERTSNYEARISIYRRDPKDEFPINVDRYLVWERFPAHRDFLTMVNTASTSDNANMRGFLADHVFLVKENAGPDHWLKDVPAEIVAVITKRATR